MVINAAAYTAVDAAETDGDRAFAVNADGPRVLAAACSAHDVPLIHVSTDYVFPGDADRPYETDDPLGPRSVYGVTKAAGEEAVLGSGARAWVVRTAWVYGAHGANFVKTMARLAASRDTLSVVDDQRGSPTWTGDLAAGPAGAGHAGGGRQGAAAGPARDGRRRHDLVRVRPRGLRGARPGPGPRAAGDVRRTTRGPRARPAYSVLSDEAWRAAGLTPLRPWREALTAAFAEDGDAFRP